MKEKDPFFLVFENFLLRRFKQIQTDSNHGRREEQQRRERDRSGELKPGDDGLTPNIIQNAGEGLEDGGFNLGSPFFPSRLSNKAVSSPHI